MQLGNEVFTRAHPIAVKRELGVARHLERAKDIAFAAQVSAGR